MGSAAVETSPYWKPTKSSKGLLSIFSIPRLKLDVLWFYWLARVSTKMSACCTLAAAAKMGALLKAAFETTNAPPFSFCGFRSGMLVATIVTMIMARQYSGAVGGSVGTHIIGYKLCLHQRFYRFRAKRKWLKCVYSAAAFDIGVPLSEREARGGHLEVIRHTVRKNEGKSHLVWPMQLFALVCLTTEAFVGA